MQKTEWYVLACMDVWPVLQRGHANPTCVLLAHGTMCSSSICILMGMEQLGKDDLKLSMKCAIKVSADAMCTCR